MASSTVSCLRDVRPPVTIHAASMYAHTFSNSSFDAQEQQKYAEAIESLKEEARGILMAATAPFKQMMLIDTLERLGLAYHFEAEIEQILQQININAQQHDAVLRHSDLYTTALGFRLLRQHQHHVSCNVFNKFVDKDGKFEEALSSDAEGVLSLYEAAHVLFRDEEILQEAARFSIHQWKRS